MLSDLFGAVAVFLLSMLGLAALALIIVGVYLAYRYDISFSIRTKDKDSKPLGTGKDESST
jgi:hypothetical protein